MKLSALDEVPVPKTHVIDSLTWSNSPMIRQAMSRSNYSRIDKTAKRVTPFNTKDTQEVLNRISSSITTDIIEFKKIDDCLKFIEYWSSDTFDTTNEKMIADVPADLILSNTIPIMDMKILFSDLKESPLGAIRSCRFILREKNGVVENEMLIKLDMEIPTDGNRRLTQSIVTAACVFRNTSKDTMTIELTQLFGIYPNISRAYPTADWHIQMAVLSDMIYVLLGSWYGIQLALTHPVVKDVFINPTVEKRDKKEVLDYRGDIDKKSKMKYVKHHYITEDNSIDKVIDKKLSELNAGNKDRPFTRKTLLWRVLGHYRTYSSGTKTWIAPYWKGLMRDTPNKEIFMENDREVITE